MKTWIWTCIVFVAAVALALVLRDHNGNVLIVAPPWHVSFSITFGVIALIAGFFGFYALLRLLSWLTGSPERFKIWRRRRAEKRDQELLQNGWISTLEGRYAQAEKELSKLLAKTKSKTSKVVAGLASAQASQYLEEYQRRDEALQIAQKNAGSDPRLKLAYATAAAELYLEQGQTQQAIDLLQPVQDASSRHFHATRLLLKAYRQQDNHERVYELTRLLLRRSAIDKTQALAYIEYAAARRIQSATQVESFKAVWNDLRTEEKNLEQVAIAAAQFLEAQQNYEEQARVLEAAIQQKPSPELYSLYANCPAEHYSRRLSKAEEWLQKYPHDPALLIALGRLCITGQLWGQAEHYLKRSMKIRNDLRVHALLAQLYDALGREEDARYHWRIAAVTAGALPVMTPNRLLPAADLQADPTLVDGHLPEAPLIVDNDRPMAASAVDSSVLGAKSHTVLAPSEMSETSENSHHPDHYFDSAPIPGVDVTMTSDGSSRSKD